MKDSFVFYKSFYDAIKKIPEEFQLELYNAIFNYSLEGIEPTNLSDIPQAMFTLIRPNIDSSQRRYKASVENGKKGGRPKKQDLEKPNKNLIKTQQKPKQNLNDNVNDNVNVNVDDNVNENVNENAKNKKNVNSQEQKIHFGDFVTMTATEYQKLIDSHGKEFTEQCIFVLDNYKGSSGKKYKSDYRAILTWVIDKVKQDTARQKSYSKGSIDDFKQLWEEAMLEDEQSRNNTSNSFTSW